MRVCKKSSKLVESLCCRLNRLFIQCALKLRWVLWLSGGWEGRVVKGNEGEEGFASNYVKCRRLTPLTHSGQPGLILSPLRLIKRSSLKVEEGEKLRLKIAKMQIDSDDDRN